MASKESSMLDMMSFGIKAIDMVRLSIKLIFVSISIVLVQVVLLQRNSSEANDTVLDLGMTLGYAAAGLLVTSHAVLIFSSKARDKED